MYIGHIVWLLSVTICLLLEVSCFWLFVKLLVYHINVESFAIQDYRGAQCPPTLFRGNTENMSENTYVRTWIPTLYIIKVHATSCTYVDMYVNNRVHK